MKNKSILLIGNHLSTHQNNLALTEQLAGKLQEHDWQVLTTSDRVNKLTRLLAVVGTIISKRKKYKIALVDVFSGPAFIWAFLSAFFLKIFKKPFILVLHGGNLPSFSKKFRFFVRQLFDWANAICSPSTYLQKKLSHINPDIIIIPNPLEIKQYPFIKRKNPSANLIWLRAFHQIYNPNLVPATLALLTGQFPEINISMIGPDKGDGSLKMMETLAKKHLVEKQIKITLGVPKDQVPVFLNQGDIFINTTNIDNTPVSVIEALACGLAVVSTNVGGIPYLLQHEEDALLVPPNDPEAMAAAVRRLLTEPGLAERLSVNARKKAEQFDWEVILPQWEKLFEEVLSTHEQT